jgi:hypothetical protein
MSDGPITKRDLDELMTEFRAWRDERAPVDAGAARPKSGNAALVQSIVRGIAPVVWDELKRLEQRIAELERNQKTYLGVWKEGREYSSNSEVTFEGGRWYCAKRTSDKPGHSADWTLMEKSTAAASPRSDTGTAAARQNGHYATPRTPTR